MLHVLRNGVLCLGGVNAGAIMNQLGPICRKSSARLPHKLFFWQMLQS